MCKKIIIFLTLILSYIASGEEESITFTLPQAIIVNPKLIEEYPKFKLNKESIYEFEFLYSPEAKKFIKTKIGFLGLIVTSVDRENKILNISYASLPKRSPMCEIFLPSPLCPDNPGKYALQMIVLANKNGPKILSISLGMVGGNYTNELNAELKGPTLILIPLNLFDIDDISKIKSVKCVVPEFGDRDGLGGYALKEIRFVLK